LADFHEDKNVNVSDDGCNNYDFYTWHYPSYWAFPKSVFWKMDQFPSPGVKGGNIPT